MSLVSGPRSRALQKESHMRPARHAAGAIRRSRALYRADAGRCPSSLRPAGGGVTDLSPGGRLHLPKVSVSAGPEKLRSPPPGAAAHAGVFRQVARALASSLLRREGRVAFQYASCGYSCLGGFQRRKPFAEDDHVLQVKSEGFVKGCGPAVSAANHELNLWGASGFEPEFSFRHHFPASSALSDIRRHSQIVDPAAITIDARHHAGDDIVIYDADQNRRVS